MARAESRLVGGRYQLMEPIGRGGMGVVWRAHDQLLDRPVAVKEVRYDSAMGDELSDLNRRTMREARAAGRLTHPNVVVVHDVIEEDDRPWIIMQLVQSRSLGQVIREDGPLSPERTVEIGLQILDALRAAHRQGVLHRDVKPENVLLTDDGRVVLTDFGIARLEADNTMTRTGLVGTPAFIAPERLRGEAAQRESDLWSLGATLYTAAEGRPPHDRGMAMATMHAVLNEAPAPARRAGALGPVLMRMLAKEPADRPGYDELVRQLKRAARDLAPPPARSDGPSAPVSPAAPGSSSAPAEAAAPGGAGSPAASPAVPGSSAPASPRPTKPEASPSPKSQTREPQSPEAQSPEAQNPEAPQSRTSASRSEPGKASRGVTPYPPAARRDDPSPASSRNGDGPDAKSGRNGDGAGQAAGQSAGRGVAGDTASPGETTSPIPVVQDDDSPGSAESGSAEPGRGEGRTGETASDAAGRPNEMPETGVQAAPPARTKPSAGRRDEAGKNGEPAAGRGRPQEADARDGSTRISPAVGGSSAGKPTGQPTEETSKDASKRPSSRPAAASGAAAATARNGASEHRRTDARAGTTADTAAAARGAGAGVGGVGGAQGAPAAFSQEGAVWHDSTTTPGASTGTSRAPGGLLKAALMLVGLVVIVGVAGYLGVQAGRSGSEEKPSSGSAAGPAETGKNTQEATAAASSSAAPSSTEPSATPSEEATASPSPKPSKSSEAPGPGDVPDGWHKYKHSSGFSLALPKGWHVDGSGNGEVRFRGDSHTYLEVHHTSSPESDALKTWRRDVPGMSGNFPGYKLVEIREVKDFWKTAADWEFTFGDSRFRSRVIDRGFVTDKNNGYALLYKTQDEDWKKKKKTFETIAATFKPAK
ncbi:protein kinase [Microbispora amethystogenes]|uniref:serine/threonine protein kinase n=1 Tax=Microbispora amethystogenes TaxID=1427754 RepID=UPI0033EF68D2